jgi:hypothetical protein
MSDYSPKCYACGQGLPAFKLPPEQAQDKPATAEPKRVREWRYEENGYWAEYRSGGRDGRVQRRSQDCPKWYDDIQTIADMEEHVRTNPRYRETTPQPAPAPVAGNVPPVEEPAKKRILFEIEACGSYEKGAFHVKTSVGDVWLRFVPAGGELVKVEVRA